MAQRKARKHSSSLGELGKKTKEELTDILSHPSQLTPYLNRYVEDHAEEAEASLLQTTVRLRRQLLYELANTRPDAAGIRRFQAQWKRTLREESAADLVALRETLRFVWSRPGIHRAEGVLNEWLAERLAPAAVAGRGKGRAAGSTRGALPFVCSLGAGRLVPDREDLRAMLIQGVFENWRYLSLCANDGCAAPYFVARRRDQVVCDAEICKAEKQRAHALKWWHEHRDRKG